jgi:hypothetical protein
MFEFDAKVKSNGLALMFQDAFLERETDGHRVMSEQTWAYSR